VFSLNAFCSAFEPARLSLTIIGHSYLRRSKPDRDKKNRQSISLAYGLRKVLWLTGFTPLYITIECSPQILCHNYNMPAEQLKSFEKIGDLLPNPFYPDPDEVTLQDFINPEFLTQNEVTLREFINPEFLGQDEASPSNTADVTSATDLWGQEPLYPQEMPFHELEMPHTLQSNVNTSQFGVAHHTGYDSYMISQPLESHTTWLDDSSWLDSAAEAPIARQSISSPILPTFDVQNTTQTATFWEDSSYSSHHELVTDSCRTNSRCLLSSGSSNTSRTPNSLAAFHGISEIEDSSNTPTSLGIVPGVSRKRKNLIAEPHELQPKQMILLPKITQRKSQLSYETAPVERKRRRKEATSSITTGVPPEFCSNFSICPQPNMNSQSNNLDKDAKRSPSVCLRCRYQKIKVS
jgi:hypothetical protein